MDDNSEFFTRATWRPSKKRKMQKRTKPWGGRKTAPPELLAAGKRVGFTKGRTNRRICTADKRAGGRCGNLALTGLNVCGCHGGFGIWAKQGKLQSTGKSAALKAARAAAVEDRTPAASPDLLQLPIYRQADQWSRMRMIKAWGSSSWLQLAREIQLRVTKPCV